jgi:hypothetical protein
VGTVKSRMRLGMRKLAVTLGDVRARADGEPRPKGAILSATAP